MKYGIYDVRKNEQTVNWGGSEWVIDGEYGIDTFPGYWEKDKAIKYYQNKWPIDKEEEVE